MKILMTGMGSSHCSLKGNMSFFKALHSALSEIADVTICEPDLAWTRSYLYTFDAVIVGMTPPTSLSANKIYGALHVLDLMYESPKLRLVIDGQQVWQYKNSLEAFKRDPLSILSPMHSKRQNYSVALKEHTKSIESVADKMRTLQWPLSYVPLLPWNTVEDAANSLEFIPANRLVGLNLDSLLLDRGTPTIGRTEAWAVEDIKSSWWASLAKTLRFGAMSTVSGTRAKDSYAEQVLKSSLGAIIPPQGRKVGTWWSYRYIQALNTNTPVITQWQDSIKLSESWAKLAYQLEDMEPYEREYLADLQYKTYVSMVRPRDEVVNNIRKELLEFTEERKNA